MYEFIMFVFVLPLVAMICGIILALWAPSYEQSSYYKTTHKPYRTVRFDKGLYGEYLIYKYLKNYEEDGAKFLFNCYLPKENGQTTEVDVIMVHRSGVYVFESKNYSGWIFGSEQQKFWTQNLPNGRRSHKERFFNPIMQNKLHIRCLEQQIGKAPFFSFVVFSERCALRKITVESPNTYVIKRNGVFGMVSRLNKAAGAQISQDRVNEIYTKLLPYTKVSDAVKEKHIADIKKAHGGY